MTIEDDIDEVSENSKTEEQKQSNILDYITDSDTKKIIESKQPSDKSFNKRRVRKPKKKLFQVVDTSSDTSNSSSKQLMTVLFDEDNEMLFTGLIDVRNDKPSFDKLTSMLNDTDRYKTVYWDPYRTELEQATQDERLDHRDFEDKQRLIDTLDQIDRILDQNKTRSKQIHRPRSRASRIFVDNIEMISNQLFIKHQPIKVVAKHFKVSNESMNQRVRQYFRYSKIDIDKFSKHNMNSDIINKLISDALQAYLDKRFGMHTTVKMMIDYLKQHFNDKTQDYSDIGFKL